MPLGNVGSTCETPIPGNEVPACSCPVPPPVFTRVGISTSFWEPARIAETVSEPWCFPSLGLNLGLGFGAGAGSTESVSQGSGSSTTFFHVHWIIFPVQAILGTVINGACVSPEGFDIAYPTEIDPLWNDDQLTALIQPESVLFANPLAQLACSVDAVASNAGCSMSHMPWCMGSWGSAYPLTGNLGTGNRQTASAGAAARMLYKLSRQFLVLDYAQWNCTGLPAPVWIKHHWRLQNAMPVRGLGCQPIGRSSLFWGPGMTPSFWGNNPVWMVWRHRGCCAF